MRSIVRLSVAALSILVPLSALAGSNLLTNPGFDGTLAPWVNLNPSTINSSLLPVDRLHAVSSGSAQLVATGAGEVAQCVQTGPGTYTVGGDIWIPPFQTAPGTAFLEIAPYPTSDCSGLPSIHNYLASLHNASGDFVPFSQIGVVLPAGTASVLVALGARRDQNSGSFTAYFDNVYLRSSTGCLQNSITMCLNGGRFQVRATYQPPVGAAGLAKMVPLTPDSGYMWFFNPENIEVVLKVLDACSFDGHHWVFDGGLTNVLVNITVTDTQNGVSRTYNNAQGTAFKPTQDTVAFACP